MPSPLLIDQSMLTALTRDAQAIPRLRKNRNFHQTDDDASHRLLIAIEPGSYIPPHRHASDTKDETIIVVKGSIGIAFFNEQGHILQTAILVAGGENIGVTIPHGCYHSLVALESGSVFFESKAGPYAPPTLAEKAQWAPQENTEQASAYYQQLEALFR